MLPSPAANTKGWALDEHGNRKAELPVASTAEGRACFTIGPAWKTVRYEIEVK